jgi:hypothetical protein
MGLVFMVWQVGTPARHAQDVAAAIEEDSRTLGDVVLQRVASQRTVTDTNASESKKFYRVEIVKP